jgi:hypothetical protein
MDPMAKPLCTPQKVAIEESTRAISMAIKPNSCALPPRQPYPFMATPPILSSLIAGNNSNGKESSTQYFVMMGWTLVSMKVRTCFRTASSSAGKVSTSS